MTKHDSEYKILLLGEGNEHKITFIKRYCYNIFNPNERLTIGVDFHVKTIEINNKKIKLKIWTVGGEERFRFLLPTYCLGANGAFVLYDITSRLSLEHLPEWIQIIREKAGDIPIMLIGSKLDLNENRAVSREEGILTAKKYNLTSFCEISIKENINVDEAFRVMIDLIEKHSQHIIEKPSPPELSKIVHKEIMDEKKNCPYCNTEFNGSYCLLCGTEKDGSGKTKKIIDLIAKRQEEKRKKNKLVKKNPPPIREKVLGQLIEYTDKLNVTEFLKALDIKTELIQNKEKCPSCSTIIKNKELKICEQCGSELTPSVNDISVLKKYIREYIIKKENEITRLKAKNYSLETEMKYFTFKKDTSWIDPKEGFKDRPLRGTSKNRGPPKNWAYG